MNGTQIGELLRTFVRQQRGPEQAQELKCPNEMNAAELLSLRSADSLLRHWAFVYTRERLLPPDELETVCIELYGWLSQLEGYPRGNPINAEHVTTRGKHPSNAHCSHCWHGLMRRHII